MGLAPSAFAGSTGGRFKPGHPCFGNEPVRPRCPCKGAKVLCTQQLSPVGFHYEICSCVTQKATTVCSRCGVPWDWTLEAGHPDQTAKPPAVPRPRP